MTQGPDQALRIVEALAPVIRPAATKKWRKFTVTLFARREGEALLADALVVTGGKRRG